MLYSAFVDNSAVYTLSLHDALPICAGEISRKYENIPAPALEQHAQLMHALGEGKAPAFDSTRADPYTAQILAGDRKSTRLNYSHPSIKYAVFCLKKKK